MHCFCGTDVHVSHGEINSPDQYQNRLQLSADFQISTNLGTSVSTYITVTPLICGLPNFNTGMFGDTLSTLHTSNSCESLDPTHCSVTSSPLRSNDQQNKCTNNAPQKLKILNVNFQSVVNKVADLHCLVETERPDVIIGTESWLSANIKDSEIFRQGYTPYRADNHKNYSQWGCFCISC